jgi:hypothetical protein
MFVNGHYIPMSTEQVLKGADAYGGAVTSQSDTEAMLWFDSLHSASSWVNTFDIESNVNLVWHPTTFDQELTVRYVFPQEG